MAPTSVYKVDASDVIVEVDDGFRRFAAENGAGRLPEGVVGRSLFDFIKGRQPLEVWRHLLLRARRQGPIENLRCRCDSPSTRRVIAIDLDPEPDGSLVFRARTVLEVERDWVPLLEYKSPNGSMLEICSWCLRVRVGEWVDIEDAVRRLRLLDEAHAPGVAHALCSDCRDRLLGDLEDD